jgi:hypothetical protein
MTDIRPLALSAAEAARALGISPDAFEREIAPKVPALSVGGATIYPVTELEKWLSWRTRNRRPSVQTKGAK